MTANAKFDRCLHEVFLYEGGYVNHPEDRGGPTNFGITLKTLADWRGTEVTELDVARLTRQEARLIYLSRYWNPVRGDDLPPGVDLVVFDSAVHLGVPRAVRMVQRVVGTTPDGVLGQKTLAAIRAMPAESLIQRICAERLEFLRTLGNWQTFKNGWQRRLQRLEETALRMARAGLPVGEVAKTDTAKAATATAGAVASVAVVLQELEPLLPWLDRLEVYGVLGLAVIAAVLGVWHWRSRR